MSAVLTRGKIGWILFRLAGPMVWGMLAVISLNLVDTYFIAQLGKQQLAAMSFSLPFVLGLMSLSLGLCVGTGSQISRALGEGSFAKVKVLTTSSLILTFGIFSALAFFGAATINFCFFLFNVPSSVLFHIQEYMWVWYFGLPAMALAMSGNTAMTSSGDMVFPALVMVVAALLNLVVDPILIFGLFGFPRLEMQGAALATVISYAAALSLAALHLVLKKKMITFRFTLFDLIASWKAVLRVGIPAASSQMIVPMTGAITVWMLSDFGEEVVGGYGIVCRLEAFALIIVVGLSNCVASLVGQNWGAKLYERVNHSLSLSYKFSIAWGAAVAALLATGHRFIPECFIKDPAVVSVVSLYLLIVPISYSAAGSLFITTALLNAIGLAKEAAAITFCRYFLLYIPLALVGMRHFGPRGIFFAISAVNIGMGVAAYFFAKRKKAVYQSLLKTCE